MKKIMVVDDDTQATSLLEAILKQNGYQAISINDSRIAEQAAVQVRPDLFLLDLMMPEIDGFKLCRILRANREFMFTPIIIITALNDNDSRIVAFGAGANDYITKPYLPKDLMQKIQEIFEIDQDL